MVENDMFINSLRKVIILLVLILIFSPHKHNHFYEIIRYTTKQMERNPDHLKKKISCQNFEGKKKSSCTQEKLIALSKLLITVARKRCYFHHLFKAAKMVLETLIKNNYICNLNNTKYFIFSCSLPSISRANSFLSSAWLG